MATTCAATIAAIVALRPWGAATAIAVKRNAIETKRKNARTSYRRQREQQSRGEYAPDELEGDRAREQPPQASPVLARRVAEPELDQRLLDREIEQALDERRRCEHERVAAEGLRRENVEGDDRGPEAEGC